MTLRHINDITLLGLSMVVVSVLAIALTAVGFLLDEFVDVYYGLIGIMILVGNFGVLCILFIPKVCVCVCVHMCVCVCGCTCACAMCLRDVCVWVGMCKCALHLSS